MKRKTSPRKRSLTSIQRLAMRTNCLTKRPRPTYIPACPRKWHASTCPQTPTTAVKNCRVNTVDHTVKITNCNICGKKEIAMCNFSWKIVWLHYEIYGCIMNTVCNCFITSIISPRIAIPCSRSCSQGYQYKSIIGVCIFSPFCCMTVSEEVTLVFMILLM